MNDDAVRLFTLYARPSALTRAVLQRGARRPRVHPLAHLCHLNCVSAELGYAFICCRGARVQYRAYTPTADTHTQCIRAPWLRCRANDDVTRAVKILSTDVIRQLHEH